MTHIVSEPQKGCSGTRVAELYMAALVRRGKQEARATEVSIPTDRPGSKRLSSGAFSELSF